MRRDVELIRRRHPEWQENNVRWRWLLDSLEGGDRYRQAIYGHDRRGMPVRNLIRHKREYPDPREGYVDIAVTGSEPSLNATDDDYELRRARTPVPTFLAEAIDTHLSRIYAREVRREGPELLECWWRDVDGIGTPIDHFMAETVAPLLLTLGQLDIHLDHPPAPTGERVDSRADVERLGLDRCIARVILPQNMVWWQLDETGQWYVECLVVEPGELHGRSETCLRHWTEHGSTLYGSDGGILSESPHDYGRVPIVRLFDRRRPRCQYTGQSRYEAIAERQREYYNRDSELILSDTTQAHPLLQGPEDFVAADGTIPVGPSWLLPKKRNSQGTTVTYEGFEVVNFPKDGADSIRSNKADLREDVDRDAALVRPTGHSTAPLSGLAKMFDHYDGNNRLAKVATVLARAEKRVAELALDVLCNGAAPPHAKERVSLVYPVDFDLFSAAEVASATADLQAIAARAGSLPIVESHLLGRLMRLCLPGMSDAQYALCDSEIKEYVKEQSKRRLEKPGEVGAPGPEQTVYADVHRWRS